MASNGDNTEDTEIDEVVIMDNSTFKEVIYWIVLLSFFVAEAFSETVEGRLDVIMYFLVYSAIYRRLF